MKYFLGSVLSFMISISAFAQNNPGADYLGLGEIKLAKDYFMKTMRQTPAESNYYLGEIAFLQGNMAEAKSFYEQGLAGNPESALAAIGVAKVQLKSNQKAAEDQLSEVQKKNKKDVSVILAIAKAYFDNGMKDKALAKVVDAKKADKKNPYIYIFEGDMLAKEGKVGEAAAQYDQAINFDSNNALAYMKGAKVYESINLKTATDLMKKAIAIKPDYKIAYKNIADLYYRDGFYPDAIAAYKEFFAGGNYTVADIKSYAAAQFFNKDYSAAKTILEEGLTREPNDFVLNRLSMYSNNELKDYQAGLAAGDKFFSIPLDADTTKKYIDRDYTTYGNLLSETGNKMKAIEQYKKAVELDPSKVALVKEIASICANEKMYADAADFYKKYIDLSGETIDATDYYQLGNYYLSAGANETDKAVATEFLKKADAAFGEVSVRKPDTYFGYYFRARTNAQLDPESDKGLAKPYYEKTIETVLASGEDKKSVLVESYSYLSYYYYLQYDKTKKAEDKASVKNYAEKVLSLDPENANGKALFEFANGGK